MEDRKIYLDRLLKLATKLDSITIESNMILIDQELSYGSSINALMSMTDLPVYNHYNIDKWNNLLKIVKEIFGLSEAEAEYLFTPNYGGGMNDNRLPASASTEDVANHIRAFVKANGIPVNKYWDLF